MFNTPVDSAVNAASVRFDTWSVSLFVKLILDYRAATRLLLSGPKRHSEKATWSPPVGASRKHVIRAFPRLPKIARREPFK